MELCFVCDIKTDLKNILYRNNRYDQDSGIIDFILSEVSEYLPGVRVVANVIRPHENSDFKDQIFQKCLEDSISDFLQQLRNQEKLVSPLAPRAFLIEKISF